MKKPILLSYTRNRKPHKPMLFFFGGLWQQSWSSLWGIVFAPSTLFKLPFFSPKISKCNKVVLGLIAFKALRHLHPPPQNIQHAQILFENNHWRNKLHKPRKEKFNICIWVFANRVCNLLNQHWSFVLVRASLFLVLCAFVTKSKRELIWNILKWWKSHGYESQW